MLKPDDLKLLLEDARARSTALLQLIFLTDRQAMALLRLYVTIGVAAVSGSIAALNQIAAIPRGAAVAFLSVAVMMTLGSVFCYWAMKTANVGLPGRGPEFWKWAIDTPNVELPHVVSRYLENLDQITTDNRRVNETGARALRRAKAIGMVTPVVTLLSALVARYFGY